MKDILSALRFFTILPLGQDRGEFAPKPMVVSLPLAGLIIGLLIALFDSLAMRLWPFPTVAALDVVFMAIITGGLHLDGLADTADGLYGGNSRERALEIMKDSRTGAIGVVAVACCLLAKWAGFFGLDESRFLLLMLIPAYARAGVMFGFAYLDYGRSGEGTARAFFDEPLSGYDFRWLGLLVILSLFAGWQCVLLNVGFALVTTAVLLFYRRKIGCITGDMLGAMIEVSEIIMLLFVTVG